MRYMARRISTGEWLTRDLPLLDVESTRALNGPRSITGRLAPETNSTLWSDRLRLAEDWATMIYAVDENNTIVNNGIVLPPTAYDDVAQITCAGVSAYPQGYIFTDSKLWGPAPAVAAEKNKNGKVIKEASPAIPRPDPVTIFHDLWRWIQSQPASNLGVAVTGDYNTNVPSAKDPSKMVPAVLIGDYENPYRLRKWEVPDVGSEMDSLAQATPFDYVENAAFLPDGSVAHWVEVGYPRLGRKRPELRFALGENIVITPSVATVEAGANMIVGIGNGEPGPAMDSPKNRTYQEKPWFDGRLRRHRVLTDKTLSGPALERRMQILEVALQHRYDVTSIAVIDHPNAPLSSIQLGDDIRVLAYHPEFGKIDVEVRVLSITQGSNPDAAVLTTSLSAFFMYRPTEEIT